MAAATLPSIRPGRPSLGLRSRPAPHVNVGDTERLISFVGGSVLGLYGLSRFSTVGLLLAAVGGSLFYRGVTGHCLLYEALDIDTAPRPGPSTSVRAGHGVKVEESVIVDRDVATLWRFWRNLENVGRIMEHLQRVEQLDDLRSHWVASGPMGLTFEWDAEIINERQNELIAWHSVEGSEVDSAGSIHFRELVDGRGTEIRVSLKYDAHAAQLAEPVARLLGRSPSRQIHEDLLRFKRAMESGGIAATAGQSCRGSE
jgi:uncharacterized membrane protein